MRRRLVLAFIALGPLGNLLTPAGFPAAFRSYYFVLLTFPLFLPYLYEQRRRIALFLPFFTYAFFSALSVPYASFRFLLLLSQALFVLGAAALITDVREVVSLYLRAFFVTLLIGYTLYLGYYAQLWPFSFVDRFCVLGQFGYGILRFSPGSYPNEFGILSSFVLALLCIQQKWRIFFPLTFAALFLTTTRAAYLSFGLSLLYLAWQTKEWRRFLVTIPTLCLSLLLLLQLLGLNVLEIIRESLRFGEGSSLERLLYWKKAFAEFLYSPLFGTGFGSFPDLHNVYLQMLFETGVVGMALLVGGMFFWGRENVSGDSYERQVKALGLIHVLSFALTNHNLNHHLTWFTALLYFSALYKRREIPLHQS